MPQNINDSKSIDDIGLGTGLVPDGTNHYLNQFHDVILDDQGQMN